MAASSTRDVARKQAVASAGPSPADPVQGQTRVRGDLDPPTRMSHAVGSLTASDESKIRAPPWPSQAYKPSGTHATRVHRSVRPPGRAEPEVGEAQPSNRHRRSHTEMAIEEIPVPIGAGWYRMSRTVS